MTFEFRYHSLESLRNSHFASGLGFSLSQGFRDSWGFRWSLITHQEENITVRLGEENFNVRRFKCKSSNGIYYLSCNQSEWSNSLIHLAECQRVSQFLKRNFRNERFALLVDNFKGHKNFENSNLSTVFLEPNLTGFLQPADIGFFGPLKAKYKRKLNLKLFEKSKIPDEKVACTEKEGVELIISS